MLSRRVCFYLALTLVLLTHHVLDACKCKACKQYTRLSERCRCCSFHVVGGKRSSPDSVSFPEDRFYSFLEGRSGSEPDKREDRVDGVLRAPLYLLLKNQPSSFPDVPLTQEAAEARGVRYSTSFGGERNLVKPDEGDDEVDGRTLLTSSDLGPLIRVLKSELAEFPETRSTLAKW